MDVAARALPASITRAGIWREVLEFVRLPLPLLRVGRGRFFDRNIWPDFRVFRIQRQPFLKLRLGVGLDRVDRAFRHADPAIDAQRWGSTEAVPLETSQGGCESCPTIDRSLQSPTPESLARVS